ncbi:MAG: hypothetical protein IJE06_01000 [Alistipes sp.]|nr:hypothetical protein [Alistipes sp.]
MKKIVVLCVAAVAFVSCGGNAEGVTIDEQNAMNAAYDLSLELATAVVEAESYEAFKSAREALESHEEAFREQIGGEEYLIFLEEVNAVLNEK